MRKAHYTVTGKDVQEHAENLIQKNLGLRDHSKKCTASTLYKVIFAAAARLTSIYAACVHLKDAPSGETIRKALLSTLPKYAELQRRVNRALAGDIPKALSAFGQIDNAIAGKYEGTGLGLPIVTSLMELHGGHFALESQLGQGTTAQLMFPAERSLRGVGECAAAR